MSLYEIQSFRGGTFLFPSRKEEFERTMVKDVIQDEEYKKQRRTKELDKNQEGKHQDKEQKRTLWWASV